MATNLRHIFDLLGVEGLKGHLIKKRSGKCATLYTIESAWVEDNNSNLKDIVLRLSGQHPFDTHIVVFLEWWKDHWEYNIYTRLYLATEEDIRESTLRQQINLQTSL